MTPGAYQALLQQLLFALLLKHINEPLSPPVGHVWYLQAARGGLTVQKVIRDTYDVMIFHFFILVKSNNQTTGEALRLVGCRGGLVAVATAFSLLLPPCYLGLALPSPSQPVCFERFEGHDWQSSLWSDSSAAANTPGRSFRASAISRFTPTIHWLTSVT